MAVDPIAREQVLRLVSDENTRVDRLVTLINSRLEAGNPDDGSTIIRMSPSYISDSIEIRIRNMYAEAGWRVNFYYGQSEEGVYIQFW